MTILSRNASGRPSPPAPRGKNIAEGVVRSVEGHQHGLSGVQGDRDLPHLDRFTRGEDDLLPLETQVPHDQLEGVGGVETLAVFHRRNLAADHPVHLRIDVYMAHARAGLQEGDDRGHGLGAFD